MDATARLLAAKPVYQYYKPGAAHGKRGKGTKSPRPRPSRPNPQPPERRPKAAQAAQTRKAPKKGGARPGEEGDWGARPTGCPPPAGAEGASARVEPPKSRQKDSTEQKSLMKPLLY